MSTKKKQAEEHVVLKITTLEEVWDRPDDPDTEVYTFKSYDKAVKKLVKEAKDFLPLDSLIDDDDDGTNLYELQVNDDDLLEQYDSQVEAYKKAKELLDGGEIDYFKFALVCHGDTWEFEGDVGFSSFADDDDEDEDDEDEDEDD